MKKQIQEMVILGDRATPTCRDKTCDIAENPTHWIDVELTQPYASAPALLCALKESLNWLEALCDCFFDGAEHGNHEPKCFSYAKIMNAKAIIAKAEGRKP